MSDNTDELSASQLSPEESPPQGGYGYVIRVCAACFAVLGVLLGLGLSIVSWDEADTGKKIKGVIMAPITGGFGGATLGVCLACAVAPSGFLCGPRGREWMKLIGTNNVLVARFVCVILGVILAALFTGLGVLLLYAEQ